MSKEVDYYEMYKRWGELFSSLKNSSCLVKKQSEDTRRYHPDIIIQPIYSRAKDHWNERPSGEHYFFPNYGIHLYCYNMKKDDGTIEDAICVSLKELKTIPGEETRMTEDDDYVEDVYFKLTEDYASFNVSKGERNGDVINISTEAFIGYHKNPNKNDIAVIPRTDETTAFCFNDRDLIFNDINRNNLGRGEILPGFTGVIARAMKDEGINGTHKPKIEVLINLLDFYNNIEAKALGIERENALQVDEKENTQIGINFDDPETNEVLATKIEEMTGVSVTDIKQIVKLSKLSTEELLRMLSNELQVSNGLKSEILALLIRRHQEENNRSRIALYGRNPSVTLD